MTSNWSYKLKQNHKLHVHLIGIGGTGLSAIATVLLEMGVTVSGSDPQTSKTTDHLAELGATIFNEQVADNFNKLTHQPDVVLISSAIKPENSERQAAEERGLPVVKRKEFLPALLKGRQLIAVAGTHGKSTTTSMVVQVLHESGIDAGYIIGTHLPGYGSASAGSSPYFVLEADEYDRMFLGLEPTVCVMTNVEWDHVDCYSTATDYELAFTQFASLVPPDGLIISCADDSGAERVHHNYRGATPWQTYGLHESANLRAVDQQPQPNLGHRATILETSSEQAICQLSLQVPGVHNLQNALGALAVADWCGVPLNDACHALYNFTGTARRFEPKGEVNGIKVFDDYAHHPTEVKATLSAARDRFPERQIYAIFQPHTYSRTAEMLHEMADSFDEADQVIVLDIYASREADNGVIHSRELVAASHHPDIRHVAGIDEAAALLSQELTGGTVVITLGAGDGHRVGEVLLDLLGAEVTHGA